MLVWPAQACATWPVFYGDVCVAHTLCVPQSQECATMIETMSDCRVPLHTPSATYHLRLVLYLHKVRA